MTKLEKLTDQRNITTISFDMDDTLWDFQAAMENALATHAGTAEGDGAGGRRRRDLTVQQMMDIRDEVADGIGGGSNDPGGNPVHGDGEDGWSTSGFERAGRPRSCTGSIGRRGLRVPGLTTTFPAFLRH